MRIEFQEKIPNETQITNWTARYFTPVRRSHRTQQDALNFKDSLIGF
jgi:hypothetical protein